MKNHFQQLYDYNRWANDLFTEALGKQEHSNQKIDVFYSHIVAAQLVWLNRIEPVKLRIPGVWELMDFEESSELLAKSSDLLSELVQKCDDFDQMVEYANTRGVAFETRLADILTHVANHGTHHRGQIALLLREEGLTPPASDFIFYIRNQG